MNGEGLRERSKARRREAITRAAFRLFAERGFGATTIADVAAAAEVSPRTVTLYFTSKQDLALARFTETAGLLTQALRQRSPGERALDILERWLRAEATRHDDIDELARHMLDANPELRALQTARMATAVEEGARAIAQDTGRSVDDIGPRIAAAAAAAVVIELRKSSPRRDTEDAITTALAFLNAGMNTL